MTERCTATFAPCCSSVNKCNGKGVSGVLNAFCDFLADYMKSDAYKAFIDYMGDAVQEKLQCVREAIARRKL